MSWTDTEEEIEPIAATSEYSISTTYLWAKDKKNTNNYSTPVRKYF